MTSQLKKLLLTYLFWLLQMVGIEPEALEWVGGRVKLEYNSIMAVLQLLEVYLVTGEFPECALSLLVEEHI